MDTEKIHDEEFDEGSVIEADKTKKAFYTDSSLSKDMPSPFLRTESKFPKENSVNLRPESWKLKGSPLNNLAKKSMRNYQELRLSSQNLPDEGNLTRQSDQSAKLSSVPGRSINYPGDFPEYLESQSGRIASISAFQESEGSPKEADTSPVAHDPNNAVLYSELGTETQQPLELLEVNPLGKRRLTDHSDEPSTDHLTERRLKQSIRTLLEVQNHPTEDSFLKADKKPLVTCYLGVSNNQQKQIIPVAGSWPTKNLQIDKESDSSDNPNFTGKNIYEEIPLFKKMKHNTASTETNQMSLNVDLTEEPFICYSRTDCPCFRVVCTNIQHKDSLYLSEWDPCTWATVHSRSDSLIEERLYTFDDSSCQNQDQYEDSDCQSRDDEMLPSTLNLEVDAQQLSNKSRMIFFFQKNQIPHKIEDPKLNSVFQHLCNLKKFTKNGAWLLKQRQPQQMHGIFCTSLMTVLRWNFHTETQLVEEVGKSISRDKATWSYILTNEKLCRFIFEVPHRAFNSWKHPELPESQPKLTCLEQMFALVIENHKRLLDALLVQAENSSVKIFDKWCEYGKNLPWTVMEIYWVFLVCMEDFKCLIRRMKADIQKPVLVYLDLETVDKIKNNIREGLHNDCPHLSDRHYGAFFSPKEPISAVKTFVVVQPI